MNDETNIHEQLTKAGVELDHHASDLYAKKTPVSERILRNYEFRSNVKTFRNQIDGSIWYDIPFAYTPFWDRVRSRASAASELVKIAKSLTGQTVTQDSSTNKRSNAMSRDRLTGHGREAAEVLAEIQSLERKMEAVDDAGLTSEADDIAKKEKEVVSQRDVGVELKDNGDQNAKANANWPITEEDRMAVASSLVKFAKMLLND